MKFGIRIWMCLTISIVLAGCNGETNRDQAGENESGISGNVEQKPEKLHLSAGAESIIKPADTPAAISPEFDEAVAGFRYVRLDTSVWKPGVISAGDTFAISLPGNLMLNATVSRVQRPFENIISIIARTDGDYRADITLTVENGRTSGNIAVYSEGKTFHLRYDREAELHYLAEIDPEKLDIMEGSEPLQSDPEPGRIR